MSIPSLTYLYLSLTYLPLLLLILSTLRHQETCKMSSTIKDPLFHWPLICSSLASYRHCGFSCSPITANHPPFSWQILWGVDRTSASFVPGCFCRFSYVLCGFICLLQVHGHGILPLSLPLISLPSYFNTLSYSYFYLSPPFPPCINTLSYPYYYHSLLPPYFNALSYFYHSPLVLILFPTLISTFNLSSPLVLILFPTPTFTFHPPPPLY